MILKKYMLAFILLLSYAGASNTSICPLKDKYFEEVLIAAEQGSIKDQYQGFGKHDDSKALECYTKAAEQGYNIAQYAIFRSQMIPLDYSQAIKYLMQLAQTDSSHLTERIKEELFDILPFTPQKTAKVSVKKHQKIICKFILDHAKNIQEWQILANKNNPKFIFLKASVPLPKRNNLYQKLVDMYIDLNLMAAQCVCPGFMVTCFQPDSKILSQLLEERTESDQPSFIKAYTIKNQTYFAIGHENVKVANILMRCLNNLESSFNKEIKKVQRIEKKVLENLEVDLRLLQIHVENTNELSEDKRSEICAKAKKLKENIKNQEKLLDYFKQIKKIPERVENLLAQGSPRRNCIFLDENPYFKK